LKFTPARATALGARNPFSKYLWSNKLSKAAKKHGQNKLGNASLKVDVNISFRLPVKLQLSHSKRKVVLETAVM